RDPTPDEIIACKPYLDEQIKLIDPLVIATLGRYSMARYFPNGKITQIHGQPKYEDMRAYYPLFHPAAVLRNPALRREMEADIKRLLEVVEKVKAMRGASDSGGGSSPASPPPDDRPAQQLSLF